MSQLQVLVTGATGFVGARLAAALVEEGHDVRAMTRRPQAYDGPGTPVAGDVATPDTLGPALAGVDVAYYLIHSLGSARFEAEDAAAARAFGEAAAHAGVRQIVYLGGLGGEDQALSPHLRSRREVEGLLGRAGVPVTVLRAAIVVGHGGISWEMTRQLIEHLPLLAAPSWAHTLTQPIALADVVRYLVGVLDHPRARGRVFEVGGADVLSYEDMLRRAAVVQSGQDVPVVHRPAAARAAGHRAGRARVVVRPGAADRGRRRHRAQPDRLDGHRGGGQRLRDRRGRAARHAGLRGDGGAGARGAAHGRPPGLRSRRSRGPVAPGARPGAWSRQSAPPEGAAMCFSAEADLVVGLALLPVAVVSLREVQHAREVPFAVLPLIFAAHQLVETLVWAGEPGAGRRPRAPVRRRSDADRVPGPRPAPTTVGYAGPMEPRRKPCPTVVPVEQPESSACWGRRAPAVR